MVSKISPSAPPAPAITAPAQVPTVEPVTSPMADANVKVEKSLDEEKARIAARSERYEAIARVAHEVNRELTAHAGDVPVQPHWEEASEDTRQSCINGVEFLEKNPLASPEDAHDNWCKVKVAAGWTHNGIYDAEAKRHPHLKPYGALAPEVRLKDKVYRAIVITMLKL